MLPRFILQPAVDGLNVVIGDLRVLKLYQRLGIFQQQLKEVAPCSGAKRALVFVVNILFLFLGESGEAFSAEEEDGDV